MWVSLEYDNLLIINLDDLENQIWYPSINWIWYIDPSSPRSERPIKANKFLSPN